jgi:[ribosomal protein S5]-alanine N-acetyltransferase
VSFPEFETPRLRLRGLRDGDQQFLATLDSDPEVMKYIHTGPLSKEMAIRFAESQIQMTAFRRHAGKWIAELHDGTPVGWVELGKLSGPDRDDLQVGYEFAPPHWGHGYATEAVRRILDYAFGMLELDRVAAIARAENPASVRVLEKLGFRKVGRRKDDGLIWCNEYRLQKSEWKQPSHEA